MSRVHSFLAILIFVSTSLVASSVVDEKIQNLLGEKAYAKNRAFIDAITKPKSNYLVGSSRVDTLKLVRVLKENGLLNIFFNSPQEFSISFKTSSKPNLFIKIVNDTLVNIGYYKYTTKEASYSQDEFLWRVAMVSEYASDPTVLIDELAKNGVRVVDIVRQNQANWIYELDMSSARVDTTKIDDEVRLKRSLYAHWVEVSGVDTLSVETSFSNNWHPYIAYFDSELNLLETKKIDSKVTSLRLEIANGASYMKVADMYDMKNLRDDLILKPIR